MNYCPVALLSGSELEKITGCWSLLTVDLKEWPSPLTPFVLLHIYSLDAAFQIISVLSAVISQMKQSSPSVACVDVEQVKYSSIGSISRLTCTALVGITLLVAH